MMTSEKNIRRLLCELLECTPRELPEASRRIELMEVNEWGVKLSYRNRRGELRSYSIKRDIRSFFQFGLDYVKKVKADIGICCDHDQSKRLLVHKWPKQIEEIHWNGCPDELFANLHRFQRLTSLCIEGADMAEADIPYSQRFHSLEVTGYDIRKLESNENLFRLTLHNPKHFEAFPFMAFLQYFTGTGLKTLDGVRGMPHLTRLTVTQSPISDISALSVLGEPVRAEWEVAEFATKYITLTGGYIRDIAPLGCISTLESLDISDNLVENIADLGKLNLYDLNLSHNPVKKITALEKHTNLEILDLTDTYVRDISPLLTLPKLRELTINVETLRDRRQLAELPSLEILNDMEISEALWFYKVSR